MTGGAGFIGSALIDYLVLEAGAEVLSIDKITYAGNIENMAGVEGHPNFQFLKADICDPTAMNQAFESFGPDHIYHLAAESHVDRSISDPGAFIDSNVRGTFTLLDAAKRHWDGFSVATRTSRRFIHVSTDEVYGSIEAGTLADEKAAINPSSPYAASKAGSDSLVQAWAKTYRLPTLIARCCNNYGPRQFPEKLIPRMILKALRGETLPVYKDGSNIRDWIHVYDHVHALYKIAARGRVGQVYNVGGRNTHRNIDVVALICRILDRLAPRSSPYFDLVKFVADRPGHDNRYAINPEKLETETGWTAHQHFDAGIEQTIGWYLANTDWWRSKITAEPDSSELTDADLVQ